MKFIFYSVLILFVSCNKTSKSVATTPPKTDVSKVVITYEATPCFGHCPSYKITITGATQIITYQGFQNVDSIGTYTKPYPNDSIIALVNEFDKAKFFELEDKYLGYISDFPSQITTYTIDGKTKKVTDRQGAPPQLRELEGILRIIANPTGWKKTEE